MKRTQAWQTPADMRMRLLFTSPAGLGHIHPMVPLARAMAAVSEALARVGVPPLLARGQLHFFLWNAAPDSTRAQEELGWEPTALEDGVREALAALG